ncbi:MAG: DNA primase [Chloroflexi bacterium RBG_19FT_COMBO_47_15]|nr:MAG: DNA primase [Chloroflexi bacterium RBG_19FT_COMBO_47_15]
MSVIDDVKQRLDIVQVVSEYTKLQKSGRNYKALCPFHSEKTPSFFVFPERQSWHCFGACGTGGDIFSFIIKKEGVDFAQALHLLANKAGVSLVALTTPEKQTQNKEREGLFEINEAAAEYYHHLLLNTSVGKIARNYVAKRGLSPETIKNFQLGFAPEGWETIKQYLKDKGYGEADLLAAGLLVERDDKNSYDRFRSRLIFPIRNIQGKAIGFGGRALDDSLPKYLNSPQTPVFDKSSSLYGIDHAKTAIRQKGQAVIVEGYMDVLTAHQHGYDNVVASMGTAMTDKHLAIIKNLTKNLILALDADTAGEEAISRSGEMIDKMLPVPPSFYGWVKYEDAHNAEVKILVLPQDKDPDDIIKEDASQWQKLIVEAKPMVDFIFKSVTAKVDLASARDKSSAAEKLLPLLFEMKDPLRQAHYVERLARLLKIDEHILGDALKKLGADERKRKATKNMEASTPVVHAITSSSHWEQYCLALLLQFPELKAESAGLSPDYFENSENRELFVKWQQSDDIASLENSLDSALQEYLESLLAKTLLPVIKENETIRRETFNDCVNLLQKNMLKNLEVKKQELFIEAQMGGTAAQLAKLEEQGIEVSQQIREVDIKQNHRRRLARRDGQ